ncbi:hypothetical protein DL991_21185 [Amycolatopsis sp. WAC 01375]|uniref:hypothetical protein n=1 Tax=unclassified Amycolatopsis TaxID=2618356 RepID=UPI000F78774E|nr:MULTISPECIES: hypothetical protein [unclassified Amycolatopsis]RSM77067.1 hypothetical protein DL991_21185 [Amycolatopsis sp. WAC 01375]RSN23610.1 hypothetical protein DL990_34900 [Amycolatopsis sp. WAC 01416]
MMKNRMFAGLAIVAFAATAFSAPALVTTTAQAADAQASCRGRAEGAWNVPGDGDPAGTVRWHDYNQDTGDDQDNFELADKPGDGKSVSLRVKNHATGKEYYEHIYSGATVCMGVGNVPNGDYVYWSACSWDDGAIVECRSGTITE